MSRPWSGDLMPSTARSTVLTLLATAAMAAASVAAPVCAVAQRGPGVQARTSTVRAVCSGGGEIAVTVQQPGDGSVSAFAVASDLPVGSLWDGGIGVFSTSGGGGGGSSIFTGSSPDSDGTLAFDIS